MILSNQLVPGSRLKEDTWATKSGVSRISVREALNRLLGEGVLVKGERSGYFVRSMDATDIREIRELREILELGALRIGFHNLTSDDVSELEKICDDFTLMVNSGYFSGACEADMKFHETLVNIACNTKLKQMYQLSNIPLFHLKLGRLISQMDDYEQTDREHRQIVRSLKEGNLTAAEKCLLAHLRRGEQESLELQ